MFEDFLYLLRRNGLKVSLTEWMALMEAMDKGLHGSSFTGFYHLCRCLLVKSEADFDRFDRCFLEYFKDVPFQQEVSQELMDWLNRPDVLQDYANWDEEQALKNMGLSEEEIERMLKERMQEQKEQHNGGNYWVGTHGMSTFGNSGLSPKGIRVGGQSMYKRAFRVAGERKFRDFRRDNTLDTRQFQVALRHLRQFSGLVDLPPTEFDVDNTIKDTADSGGMLKVRYKRPRENTVKVLLLMDSGGSMDYYSGLCSQLFDTMAQLVTPGEDAIRIVNGLDPDGLHRLAVRLSEATSGLCAVLTPTDKGTGYCLAQADGDVRALTKALNTALNGRGGGKPGICQGSCAATPEEAAEFLKNRE